MAFRDGTALLGRARRAAVLPGCRSGHCVWSATHARPQHAPSPRPRTRQEVAQAHPDSRGHVPLKNDLQVGAGCWQGLGASCIALGTACAAGPPAHAQPDSLLLLLTPAPLPALHARRPAQAAVGPGLAGRALQHQQEDGLAPPVRGQARGGGGARESCLGRSSVGGSGGGASRSMCPHPSPAQHQRLRRRPRQLS